MATYSGLFNSVNGDRKYNAWWFALYFSTFIGNGVFPNPSNNMQVVENENMKTTVKAGKAWINGYFIFNDSDFVLQHDLADGVLKRIDRIVMRLDYISREIEITIKKGAYASSPVAAELQRDADYYELGIADIYIGSGVTEIVQANITDLRLNSLYCGIVAGVVDQIDVSSVFNQYQDWFNSYSVAKAQEFLDWQNQTQAALLTWIDSAETDFDSWRQAEEALYYAWSQGRKAEFDAWFLTIKDILDTNAAGNLLNLIDDHKNASMPHKFLIGPTVYKYGMALNPTLNCMSFIYEEVL